MTSEWTLAVLLALRPKQLSLLVRGGVSLVLVLPVGGENPK